jgi:hypothetical protein
MRQQRFRRSRADNIGFRMAEGEKAASDFLRKRTAMVFAPAVEKLAAPHPQAKGTPEGSRRSRFWSLPLRVFSRP